MEPDVHELTAAYALDALDEGEEREYEEHLRRCARCRTELADLSEAAAALAYGIETPPPPPALRSRILEQARRERPNVVPLRSRRRTAVLAGVAAAAAVAALAVGLWANSLSNSLDAEREANRILADPTARTLPLSGGAGRVVVTERGDAALVVSRLAAAPAGKTYEVWVARATGGQPRPAGLFDAEEGRDLVLLEETVPPGARVMITLERDGGVDAPTSAPLTTART